ncbi:alkylation response protein AidB-like acyl-CoA dehydrogenase [Cryobacterium mesophilum]|uniref:Acyl-CoA dehydrogenase n=1 Tax=Terrimesophilobacter mesophilus TaxID=433647 RepID=A0A4R8V9H9_9MICO|nr:acyl-CoA dehydrogenase family protein [Terrimesophilobacter mesophilus]MBB5631780.1 alkylation response protein AidB-like acyl-CoA dehydrogenase [Terrimesophilobacter mesophilus]TFB78700.1 acyl-CoA dehydrogenase [Terrimesophilobacter mesophilus]
MSILSESLLQSIHDRAAGYDRDNAFVAEDLAELRSSGYLTALVPTSMGGLGLSLQDVVHEQMNLAAAAPATALAVNMHLVWTGVAKTMLDRGDDALEFVLREAAEGELFALAISEAGNDLVLFGSATDAAPVPDGGYEFTGTKIFTSLSPAWTRLGLFGLDTTSPDAPKLVHAVVARDAAGITILDDWDTLGMRASQSSSTRLEGVRAEPQRVFRRLDPGPSPDLLIFSIFSNFETLLSAVYTGIARRALELGVENAMRRKSAKNAGEAKSLDPDIRWKLADAAIAYDAILPQLDAVAADIDAGVDRGDQWFRALVGLKLRATDTAKFVVDQAIRVSGGGSYFSGNELGRLYRDVLAGGFHPSNEDSAHATVASALLGPLP